MATESDEEVERLVAAQRRYYDLRAPDYMDVAAPSDRRSRGLMSSAEVDNVMARLNVAGDVLELACGPGEFTKELLPYARSLTALDSSPRMLNRSRELTGERVDYICADLFTWTPTRQFDLVFFGFWLSHVPPTRFESFWSTVRACLRPDGRVGFVDEDERAKDHEAALSDGPVPTATRTLGDGRTFDIVKVFWRADDLERRLQAAGWAASVEPLGATFLFGEATPA